MADILDEEWIERYLAGEWVPSAVVEQDGKLHKFMAQHSTVWSVARDAYRIRLVVEGEAGMKKRRNFTFRGTDQMHEELSKASAATGRSISEEIEARLNESFIRQDIERTVELVIIALRDRGLIPPAARTPEEEAARELRIQEIALILTPSEAMGQS